MSKMSKNRIAAEAISGYASVNGLNMLGVTQLNR
jgi:hypothetical protein